MKKITLFLSFVAIIVSEFCIPGCRESSVIPKGKIVRIQQNYVGIDFDNNKIPDKQIEVDSKMFMKIISANLEYDLPVTLTADSTEISSLNFGTHAISVLDPKVVQRRIDTFSWKR